GPRRRSTRGRGGGPNRSRGRRKARQHARTASAPPRVYQARSRLRNYRQNGGRGPGVPARRAPRGTTLAARLASRGERGLTVGVRPSTIPREGRGSPGDWSRGGGAGVATVAAWLAIRGW